jgi:hypothetical protein
MLQSVGHMQITLPISPFQLSSIGPLHHNNPLTLPLILLVALGISMGDREVVLVSAAPGDCSVYEGVISIVGERDGEERKARGGVAYVMEGVWQGSAKGIATIIALP